MRFPAVWLPGQQSHEQHSDSDGDDTCCCSEPTSPRAAIDRFVLLSHNEERVHEASAERGVDPAIVSDRRTRTDAVLELRVCSVNAKDERDPSQSRRRGARLLNELHVPTERGEWIALQVDGDSFADDDVEGTAGRMESGRSHFEHVPAGGQLRKQLHGAAVDTESKPRWAVDRCGAGLEIDCTPAFDQRRGVPRRVGSPCRRQTPCSPQRNSCLFDVSMRLADESEQEQRVAKVVSRCCDDAVVDSIEPVSQQRLDEIVLEFVVGMLRLVDRRTIAIDLRQWRRQQPRDSTTLQLFEHPCSQAAWYFSHDDPDRRLCAGLIAGHTTSNETCQRGKGVQLACRSVENGKTDTGS